MNIGFFYGMHTYPPTTGGSIHGYQLVRQLVANGHNLHSWYFCDHNDPDITSYRGRELFKFLQKIDLIYIRVEWKTAAASISMLKTLSFNRIPVVWEINGTPYELLFSGHTPHQIDALTQRLKSKASLCSGAITVADDIFDYATKELGINNVTIIPNGGDPEAFSPAQKNTSRLAPLQVIWLGTSSAGWNDLPCLLEAARILEEKESNITIRIIGDKAPLSNIDLPSNVKLDGSVPYSKLGDHMATADVGLHLLKFDEAHAFHQGGSPLKLFDYMACGLAAVVNCDGQQSKIIEEYGNGIVCEPTAAGVAKALVSLEQDRERCAQMGARGRNAIVSKYNWRNTGKSTSEFIEAVLTKHRSRQ